VGPNLNLSAAGKCEIKRNVKRQKKLNLLFSLNRKVKIVN